ncbi:hypothetical protein [Nocardia nova]|uniref:hypothetical protein n=1 Tax=Nocardia nova TaxID=37330 RepID=UPI001894BFC9|nr:hypothetical protein [Nocardia nova]MBF6277009.1 hypothetical protein [Nocardia nova]
MPDRSITTDTGTTISLTEEGGDTIVMLHAPAAPDDMQSTGAGRIIQGSFQPVPFAAWGLTPSALRAIAALIDGGNADA